jgi:hypothetical protein
MQSRSNDMCNPLSCCIRSNDWATDALYNEGNSERVTDLLLNNKGARVYIRNYDICRMALA